MDPESPSVETNNRPSTQEIPLLYLQLDDSLPCSQEPAAGHEPNESRPHPHIIFLLDQF
jgi:hypothetical protein